MPPGRQMGDTVGRIGRWLTVVVLWALFCTAAIQPSSAVQQPASVPPPQTEQVAASVSAPDVSLPDPFQPSVGTRDVHAADKQARTDRSAALGKFGPGSFLSREEIAELAAANWAPFPTDGMDPFAFYSDGPLAGAQVGAGPWLVAGGIADIPAVVVDAYLSASKRAGQVAPGCVVPWWVLAAIGRVESGHGMHHGAATAIAGDGLVTPAIVGLPLNGGPDVALIRDSDGGAWDGDAVWDRAVGPMQFIPSSWRLYGQDGNGDGVADPHNVFDATLGAVAHLCGSTPADLRDSVRLARAVFGYNHSADYVALVMQLARAYSEVDPHSADYVAVQPPAVAQAPTFEAPEVGSGLVDTRVAVVPPKAVAPPPADDATVDRRAPESTPRRSVAKGDEPGSRRPRQPPSKPRPEPSKDPRVGTGPQPPPRELEEPDPKPASGDPGDDEVVDPAPEGSAGEPTEEPTQEPSPEPSPEPTPEPTSEPSAEPSPEPSDEPSPEPSVEPTEEPNPDPTAEPTESTSGEPREPSKPDPPTTGVLLSGGTQRGSLPRPCVDLRALVTDELERYNVAAGSELAWTAIALAYRDPAAVLLSVYAQPGADAGAEAELWAVGTVNCRTGALDLIVAAESAERLPDSPAGEQDVIPVPAPQPTTRG